MNGYSAEAVDEDEVLVHGGKNLRRTGEAAERTREGTGLKSARNLIYYPRADAGNNRELIQPA